MRLKINSIPPNKLGRHLELHTVDAQTSRSLGTYGASEQVAMVCAAACVLGRNPCAQRGSKPSC